MGAHPAVESRARRTNAATPLHIDRHAYAALLPNLRFALLDFQQQLREAGVPVVIIIAGADGVKSETVNCLHGWFDPRGLETHVFGPADSAPLDRPRYSRYATALPARGRIGLYFGSWYTRLTAGRMSGTMKRDELEAELDRIAAFEKALVADGYLLVKIWLRLGRDEQRERLTRLARDRRTSWRVSPSDWKNLEHFSRMKGILRAYQERTDANAPWHIIDAADDRARNISVAKVFVETATERLAGRLVVPVALPTPDTVRGGELRVDGRRPRHANRGGRIRHATREATTEARGPVSQGGREGARGGARVRRLGRGRQGRNDSTTGGTARCAVFRRHTDGGTDR